MRAYSDLVEEVRAQIDVSADQALTWLMDRSRVLNAEAAWNLIDTDLVGSANAREYELPSDALWIEAVLVDGRPYQRSTLHAMDARWFGQTGNTSPIYADAVEPQTSSRLQIHPPVSDGAVVTVRYVADLADDLVYPPFPSDFDSMLVDGAIAIGLARMDERFDSASYFQQRFETAVARLRKRRHGHVGRGAISIRVVL